MVTCLFSAVWIIRLGTNSLLRNVLTHLSSNFSLYHVFKDFFNFTNSLMEFRHVRAYAKTAKTYCENYTELILHQHVTIKMCIKVKLKKTEVAKTLFPLTTFISKNRNICYCFLSNVYWKKVFMKFINDSTWTSDSKREKKISSTKPL